MATEMVLCNNCGAFWTIREAEEMGGCCAECSSRDLIDTPVTLEELEGSDEPWDGFNSDAEADADVLRSAGWGTDEDYGCFGGDEW